MLKNLAHGAAVLSLLAASALAGASEPAALTDDQMDTVAAGLAGPIPTASQFASLGALAWATSEVTSSPGVIVVIEGDVTARVGLAGNGVTFTHNARIIRTP